MTRISRARPAGPAVLLAALAALAACLAGCASGPPAGSPQAVCEAQADDDPKVTELRVKALGSPIEAVNLRSDIAFAHRQAMQACLRKLGLAPPGGVEPVRPPQ